MPTDPAPPAPAPTPVAPSAPAPPYDPLRSRFRADGLRDIIRDVPISGRGAHLRCAAKRSLPVLGSLALIVACSAPTAATSNDTGAGATNAERETRVCNWAAQIDRAGSVTIKSLLASAPDPDAAESSELCRAITAIHRGPQLRIAVASFSLGDISPGTRTCVERENEVIAGQIVTSTGADILEILAGLAASDNCWHSFLADISTRFSGGSPSRQVISSARIIQSLERRRRESLLTHLSIYDDVSRAIPFSMAVAPDGSLNVRCLIIGRTEAAAVPEGAERAEGAPSWRDCIRRIAG